MLGEIVQQQENFLFSSSNNKWMEDNGHICTIGKDMQIVHPVTSVSSSTRVDVAHDVLLLLCNIYMVNFISC